MIRSIAILILTCLSAMQVLAQFTDITAESGIEHTFVNPAFLGGGAAVLDVNADGFMDLALTGGTTADQIFMNNGDGTFSESSIDLIRHQVSDITSAAVTGDFDNDGCSDLVLTNYAREGYDLLYRGDCTGSFELIPPLQAFSSPTNSMGATLHDFNKDGLLDVYIIGHVAEIDFIKDDQDQIIGYNHTCASNRMYINQGDFVFDDVTDALNAGARGCALAATVIPLPDTSEYGILLANDFGPDLFPNELLVPSEDGTYIDVAAHYHLDDAIYGMGIALGDLNQDRQLEIYMANLGRNPLYTYNDTVYTQIQNRLQVDNTFTPDNKLTTGWGTFFLDVDNDKDLDLFVANGTIQSPEFIEGSFNDPNVIFINEDLEFRRAPDIFGISRSGPNLNRGAVTLDIENDGDLDILVSYINFEPPNNPELNYRLYKNDNQDGNYLYLDLDATTGAKNGYGSKVTVYAEDQLFFQYKYSSGTHASQSMELLHFGLGSIEAVDSIVIEWPHQTKSKAFNIPVNTFIKMSDVDNDFEILGCQDIEAENFDFLADINFGCRYGPLTTTEASNHVVQGIPSRFLTDHYTVQIFDMLGRMVATSPASQYSNKKQISPSFSQGLYVIHLLDEKGKLTFTTFIII